MQTAEYSVVVSDALSQGGGAPNFLGPSSMPKRFDLEQQNFI